MLVDVRHEATHNELPSLALLRLAAERALDWLRASYWQRQADHVTSEHARIRQLLQVGRNAKLHVPCHTRRGLSNTTVMIGSLRSRCLCITCGWAGRRPEAGGKAEDANPPWLESARQDYCGVRRAAAEKLFTHGGSQPVADVDSDAASDGAGAFAEAAAEVTAGEAPADGYQAAEGKRQRQRLLGELREAVPAAAARLLTDPLLNGSFCDPPRDAAGRPADSAANAAVHECSPPREPVTDLSSRTSEQEHELRVTAEVWRTAMATLAQQWTSLPALLAAGAVERLLKAVEAGTVDEAERWVAWLTALLQTEQSPASPQKGGSRKQSPSQAAKRKRADSALQLPPETAQPLWTPTPDQAADLVKRCLTAAAGAGAASARWQDMLGSIIPALTAATRPQEDTRLGELAQKACCACHVSLLRCGILRC